MESNKTNRQLEAELEATRLRLQEAEETLRAITNNELDAFVINGPEGPQVFTLQGAERPYRTLMETMAEGALTVAKDGTVLYCNRRLAELIKKPLQEIIGTSFHDFVMQRNRQSFQTMLYVCEEKGCRDDFFLKTTDGEKVPVSLSARLLMLNDVECFCIVATDLTDQMRAQEALEVARDHLEERVAERTAELQKEIAERKRLEQETRTLLSAVQEEKERLSALVNSIQDEVWFADTSKRFTLANPSALREFGLATDNGIDIEKFAESLEVYRPDGSPRPVEDAPPLRALRGEVVTNQEETIRTPGHGELRYRDVSASPVKDDSGTIIGSVSVVRDITTRKRTELALQESEQRWATTLASIGDAVIATDTSGSIVFMNAVAEKLTGWTLMDASQKPVTEVFNIVNEHTRRQVECPVAKVLQKGIIVDLANHTILVRKDGTEVSIDDSGAPIRDDEGNTTGVVLIFRDITERRRAEEELQKSREELEKRVQERTAELQQAYDKLMEETTEREHVEAQLRQAQKMEALGTLTGGIAHDFNNILAGIIGFTELVTDHVPKGSREAHHLKRVMESSLRGRDLVRRMLTLSRQTEQQKKPLSLSSIVKETVDLIRATTPTTISITVNTRSESGLILADPTQIQQVVMNLCTNAAHAMREKGGTLAIQLSNHTVSQSDGNPHGIEPGLYTRLTVHDTGTGISPDIMDKIFDPFFTTKKLGEGTGLGLSVVHGIIKQSNGYITVESEPGRGSTFTVYFPKVTGELQADAVSDDALPTGSERILFVDDEETLVEVGENVLAELGYEVTSRMNGKEALALFSADPSRFDLVITDQTMPEMTGVDLAKEILALRADMPIIMCTGFSYVVDADKAKAAGIRAFALKPLTKKEIARTIRKVLDE